jgi:hypothetical protein
VSPNRIPGRSYLGPFDPTSRKFPFFLSLIFHSEVDHVAAEPGTQTRRAVSIPLKGREPTPRRPVRRPAASICPLEMQSPVIGCGTNTLSPGRAWTVPATDRHAGILPCLPAGSRKKPPRQHACCLGGKRYGAGDGPAQVTVYRVADGVQTKPRPQPADCGRGESRDAGNGPTHNRVYRSGLSCQAKSPAANYPPRPG